MRSNSINNVYSRYKYLLGGIENPSSIPESHIASLSGQRNFAKLSVKNKFSEISLNTMKEAANKSLNEHCKDGDGFKFLNELRATLYEKIKDRKNGKTVTSKLSRSENKRKELEESSNKTELMNLLLTKAYSELLANIKSLQEDKMVSDRINARIDNIMRRHRKDFGEILAIGINTNTVH
ncbi:TPA: hypothetical protein NG675_003836 [Vibrio parahaemolyticus]|uniref:Uncharacterized protein n=2 Tax=Vibrio TaxID=662 RepID=A0A853QYW6_9VIBR|nr:MULTISPECIES: hypothetical protein [Vibrio]EGQ7896122.1 hypothetical protein [Vibrio parahaemolyticus]EGQ8477061.1 hypothetical protein [Vibrio parahaemolyticus]EGR1279895.1 hypothetical protein [Vibrio parahaemolyticus]EGR1791088.1 hypothetical protein [Vibrio parahaemolyticus]EGR1936733.1 hypothetical protein [Vibrio parahaemolyticus]